MTAVEKAMRWDGMGGIGVLALCASCAIRDSQSVDEAPAPARASADSTEEIARFLRAGDTLQLSKWADLDGDSDNDAIAVASPASTFAPRTLLILSRRPDATLERVVDNPRAVPPATAGGMLGDPLRDVEAHGNGFTLHLEGGSRELWSRSYRFGFSNTADTWLLESVTDKVLDRHDGVSNQTRKDPKDFGTVRVDQFDIDEIPRHPRQGCGAGGHAGQAGWRNTQPRERRNPPPLIPCMN